MEVYSYQRRMARIEEAMSYLDALFQQLRSA